MSDFWGRVEPGSGPFWHTSTLIPAKAVSLSLLGKRADGSKVLVQTILSRDAQLEQMISVLRDLAAAYDKELESPSAPRARDNDEVHSS